MLRIGLTGGIGSGKSVLSTTFAQCGGIIVDGDVLAREVVEPGTEGLAALVDAFGDDILLPSGALDRPALAAKAFRDDESRTKLNGIVHPLVARRRAEILAAVAQDAVVVEDIPLLVESGMAPLFPLVVIVHADAEQRVRRLIEHRGMPEADARARIAAQATDEQRREVADIWLDNSGSVDALIERARDVWYNRILPFAHNLGERRCARAATRLVPADPSWPDQARRVVNRLKTAAGHRALRVDHIGSTAVPGYDAKDVIDIQITVESLAVADELAESLLSAGYPRLEHVTQDVAKADARSTVDRYDHSADNTMWHKRFHASADPGRPTNVHIRVDGWPNQQFALLFVAWLRANPGVRADYLSVKRAAEQSAASGAGDIAHYAAAKEPWFLDAYRRAWDWADSVGWRP
ncbi:dephospho-CoA kinase [Mycobacterium kansasii 732]|uniref:Dephospho-CoA kinase n=1 Tax=Mycobacterium pseudokansasii TaxID=2341080 RepID=A0A498QUA8_9MYCO|nr:dephospho-CoA kinase [Mycobacterium pseudokansasii]ETZ97708.1 dephospho-CoA kinase [Mycobacterium kansasii 732]KZS63919.1 dephospho-CoA kinase [Mycobacterium kansasii]MBY0390371.1 dephospho-CoA kinase, long form [Mycobacterium pseudokansasii]VAZ94897.1 Dephospho-CoA kinase [Mycobacterium pseudokansasii]VAZ96008.1 Dephospho-CoA kinase [Mycobacterium pseudokansasii]